MQQPLPSSCGNKLANIFAAVVCFEILVENEKIPQLWTKKSTEKDLALYP